MPRHHTDRAVAHAFPFARLAWIAWMVSIVGAAAGAAAAGPAPAREKAAAPPPNIVLILADDQATDTIHALTGAPVETPNLDRLVRESTVFTRAYNQGSWTGAVCVASRTMLNTGRFLWHAHRVHRTAEKERQAGRFWSELMRRRGYETYMTGKWHVRASAKKAFDHVVHVRPGMPKQTPEGYNRPIEGKPDPWKPWDTSRGGFWEGGTHWSEVLAADAVGFIEEASRKDRPFFMYLAFNAAHDPRQSPKEYVDRYPVAKVPLPANYLPEYPEKDAIGCGKKLRDERLAPFPRTPYAVKVHRREYYALVTHMDAQIGRILAALERSGMAGRTWVFYTADHGLAVGRHGLFGKQNLFEHSVRVPLLVRSPGDSAGKSVEGKRSTGKRIDTPVYLQDVFPTALELAGIPKPAHVEFKSLLPLLRGDGAPPPYDAIYGAYLDLQRSVTVGRHKLILYPRIGAVHLFDLERDPLELEDLAADPGHRPVVRRLFARLLDLQKEVGDSLDLRKTYAKLAAGTSR